MNHDDFSGLPERIRVMQIIAGALPFGLAMFLMIAIFFSGTLPRAAVFEIAGVPIITLASFGMLVMQVPAALIVSQSMMSAGLRNIAAGLPLPGQVQPRSQTESLLGLYQTVMLIRMSLFEGAGFLACIAYLMEGHAAALVVAGLCLAILLAHFPTEGRVRDWLEQQERRLHEARR